MDHDVVVARSPLEVIRLMETDGPSISTVVISDLVGSVVRAELAEFLAAAYPYVRVIMTEPTRSVSDGVELEPRVYT